MKTSGSLILVLKLLLTILLLFLVFQSIDVSKISSHLQAFSLHSLLLLLVLCWMGQLLCAERWRVFASSLGLQGGYRSFVQMYFIGMFFNIGLPSLVGGDAIKAYILSRKNGKPLHLGLASVLQDRAAGLISLLAYGSIAVLLRPISWRGIPLWSVYLVAWTGVAFALLLVLRGERVYRGFLVPGSHAFPQRILRTVAEFHQALGVSSLRPASFFRITLYSFINSGLVLWIFQQITVAAGYKVGIVPFSVLYPLVTLATMLPVTLSGLGIRELIYVEALVLVGIPRGPGLVISLATSALLLLCNLGGMPFLTAIPAELRRQAYDIQKSKDGQA